MTVVRWCSVLLLVFGLCAAGASTTSAQPWDGIPSGNYGQQLPFPDPYDAPVIPERNEVNDYVDWSPLDGLFFSYDRVFFLMTPPRATTVGDPNTTYVVPHDAGGTVTLSSTLDTSWIDPNGDWGDRFQFGWSDGQTGWMMNVLNARQRETLSSDGALIVFSDPQSLIVGFRDSNTDGIDDDLDGDGIFGGDGQDTTVPLDGTIDGPAPVDADDLLQFLPQFTQFDQYATTTLTGVEAMAFFTQPGPADIGMLDFFGGVRYLRVRDNYRAVGFGGVLDTSFWDSNVDNHLIGPQVGARWSHRYSFVSLVAEVRGMSAYNRQHARFLGQIASEHESGDRPTHLYANSFNSSFERQEFSPLTEWRAELLLELVDGLSMRFGYTGMYMGGISRAAPKVDYTLPSMGFTSRENDTSLFANGLSLGVQLDF